MLIRWTNTSARCSPISNRCAPAEPTIVATWPQAAATIAPMRSYRFCIALPSRKLPLSAHAILCAVPVQVGTRYGKVSEEELRTENLRLAEELAKKQALIDKLTTM
jgi:hypothetical protein